MNWWEIVISSGIGFCLGLLISEVYWRRRMPIETPLLYLEGEDDKAKFAFADFYLVNKGMTRAMNLTFEPEDMEYLPAIELLEPAARKWLIRVGFGRKLSVNVSFVDVWGGRHKDKWRLEGPSSWDKEKMNLETLEYIQSSNARKM